MMDAPERLDGPSQRQAEASDPRFSAWVTANAGSGKTKVLIDRVARLLLGHAKDPSRLLCLTYTKAAAANMQNKLFERLGGWALMNDDDLRRELAGLGLPEVPESGSEDLRSARRLFAQALETPGGLKIQTIHAFCESLLRRFPLEAGLSPHFSLMDDAENAALRQDVLDRVLTRADSEENSALSAAVERVVTVAQESGIHPLVSEIISKRAAFSEPITTLLANVREALEVPEGETEDTLLAAFFEENAVTDIRAIAAVFRQGGKIEQKFAAEMTPLLESEAPKDWLVALRLAVMTKSGTPKATGKSFPTKAAQTVDPAITEKVQAFQIKLAALDNHMLAAAAVERSHSLIAFAQALIEEVNTLKEARDGLDFDDLIERAGDLLQNRAASAWVRYKLDGGVDHILVDEAQDTSPDQWRVISAIAEEFFAGEGARPEHRTLFVVGDEKQSIFSFQGAAPKELDRVRGAFRQLIKDAKEEMREPKLLHSFRSSPTILGLVDKVFQSETAYTGLSAENEAPQHEAFFDEMPGRVEFWPPIGPLEEEEPTDWWEPVDTPPVQAPELRLAQGIVTQIAGWLDPNNPAQLPSTDRAVRAGDILILVRRRNAFAEALIRMLKAARLPVAGKDRMKLHTQLAVRDLLALARFVLLPDDDLTLATVLRSPLVGFSEDDLFDLAHGRRGRLWNTLYARRDERPIFGTAASMLNDMLAEADYLRPYEFFERILTLHGARGRLLDRLGVQAADPIDELLNQALDFETRGIPSLQGFVARIEESDVDIKREMEQGRDEIRIMTVHGSKGLEANIVFMPDICAMPKSDNTARVFPVRKDAPVWVPQVKAAPPQVAEMRNEAGVLSLEEYRRLLYVGMTRARDWLILCGWHGSNNPGPKSWAALVDAAFDEDTVEGSTPLLDENNEPIPSRVFQSGGTRKPDNGETAEGLLQPLPLTADLEAMPPSEASPLPPVNPSGVGKGDAEPFVATPMPTESEDSELPLSSADRGTMLHLLLERLAGIESTKREMEGLRLAGEEGDALVRVAMGILDTPEFAWMFGENSMAEVPVQGPVSRIQGREILGIIDRLVMEPDAVHIVDFKSGRPPADGMIPAPYLRQLALYRAALSDIFDGRSITASLLWIDASRLDTIPMEAMDQALVTMLADGSLESKSR